MQSHPCSLAKCLLTHRAASCFPTSVPLLPTLRNATHLLETPPPKVTFFQEALAMSTYSSCFWGLHEPPCLEARTSRATCSGQDAFPPTQD